MYMTWNEIWHGQASIVMYVYMYMVQTRDTAIVRMCLCQEKCGYSVFL